MPETQAKRLIVALTPTDYQRLAEAAARNVRQPEQEIVYRLRRSLANIRLPKPDQEVPML